MAAAVNPKYTKSLKAMQIMTTILGGCCTVPQMFYFPNFVFPIYNLQLTSGYHHVFSVHPFNSKFTCYHLGSLISKHSALDHYAINMYSLRNQYIFIMLSICIHGSFNICSMLCFFYLHRQLKLES